MTVLPTVAALPEIFEFLVGVLGTIWAPTMFAQALSGFRLEREAKNRDQEAERKIADAPDDEKSLYRFRASQSTLKSYFVRNLQQLSTIFWINVCVMLTGASIILGGIWISFTPNSLVPAIITSSSGVFAEFIGVTFLVLYRSAMDQAGEYTKTLERFACIEIAMQILDTIPNNEAALSAKNKAKVELSRAMVVRTYDLTSPSPINRSTAAVKTRGSAARGEAMTPPIPAGQGA